MAVRIEHPLNGKGPYRLYNPRNIKMSEMIDLHDHDSTNWPEPKKDKGIDRDPIHGKEVCGFLDMDQLLSWFSEEDIENMESLGYKVVEYSDELISAVGENQVLIKKETRIF